MANLERIAEIRDYLQEQVPDAEFNMGSWGLLVRSIEDGLTIGVNISCESPGCIAGHVCVYYALDFRMGDSRKTSSNARNILGLTEEEADKLFYVPDLYDRSIVTPQDAAKVLDCYLKTGEFNWDRVLTDKEIAAKELELASDLVLV